MAFIDHIPGDLNSVNKIIKIPTIPSAVLDTDKTNNKHVTQILSYCGVKNVVFPNLPIVYDVCTNNISVEGTICCISIY
jgi:hypothetical protein